MLILKICLDSVISLKKAVWTLIKPEGHQVGMMRGAGDFPNWAIIVFTSFDSLPESGVPQQRINIEDYPLHLIVSQSLILLHFNGCLKCSECLKLSLIQTLIKTEFKASLLTKHQWRLCGSNYSGLICMRNETGFKSFPHKARNNWNTSNYASICHLGLCVFHFFKLVF